MNYSEDYTPRTIARAFLKQQLLNARERCKTERFDNVVICIPQVWSAALPSMSGKTILREICMELKQELELLDKVTIVSEPAAASAYYAYLHQKQTGEPFNERMLIVDYGGGTLDISLTKVSTVSREDGSTAFQIDVEGETGAGENHGQQIGDAGLAYLDGTVRLAMKEAGFASVPYNGSFIKAVNIFESALINRTADIRDKVQLDCANDVSRLEYDDEVLTTLFYQGKKIPVTYSVLYRAYEQIIRPVLAQQLGKVKREYLDPLNVDPRQVTQKLKLALVGGFGQFELVRQQVYDFFHLVRGLEDGGREDAICYGAALIADGAVTLRNCARLSMGLVSRLFDEKTFDFAITRRMDLEYGKVYQLPRPLVFGGSGEWEFALSREAGEAQARCLMPVPPVQEALNRVPAGCYRVGLSMDDLECYTLHMTPTNPVEESQEEALQIPLGSFSQLFGTDMNYDQAEILRK